MGRNGRRRKPAHKTDPRNKFIKLPRWLFDSAAYRSLNSVERDVLHETIYRHNGLNNGSIPLSYRDALNRAGTKSNRAVNKALEVLQARGFTRCGQKGNFNLKLGHATEWILTSEFHNGREPTKDFMRWKSPADDLPVQKNKVPISPGPKKKCSGPAG